MAAVGAADPPARIVHCARTLSRLPVSSAPTTAVSENVVIGVSQFLFYRLWPNYLVLARFLLNRGKTIALLR
jgi:hypothetical protein